MRAGQLLSDPPHRAMLLVLAIISKHGIRTLVSQLCAFFFESRKRRMTDDVSDLNEDNSERCSVPCSPNGVRYDSGLKAEPLHQFLIAQRERVELSPHLEAIRCANKVARTPNGSRPKHRESPKPEYGTADSSPRTRSRGVRNRTALRCGRWRYGRRIWIRVMHTALSLY